MMADPTLLHMKYADVVKTLASKAGISLDEALKRFYESAEYDLLSQGISDVHCQTPDYIAQDILEDK